MRPVRYCLQVAIEGGGDARKSTFRRGKAGSCSPVRNELLETFPESEEWTETKGVRTVQRLPSALRVDRRSVEMTMEWGPRSRNRFLGRVQLTSLIINPSITLCGACVLAGLGKNL